MEINQIKVGYYVTDKKGQILLVKDIKTYSTIWGKAHVKCINIFTQKKLKLSFFDVLPLKLTKNLLSQMGFVRKPNNVWSLDCEEVTFLTTLRQYQFLGLIEGENGYTQNVYLEFIKKPDNKILETHKVFPLSHVHELQELYNFISPLEKLKVGVIKAQMKNLDSHRAF